MSIIWTITESLKAQNINNASQLQKLLEEKLGISISRQSLHKLINNKPCYLKMETLQAICNLLGTDSSEFLRISPEKPLRDSSEVVKLYKKKKDSDFAASDPRNFLK
jgi:DNA-binding Xre family transcriptional regulator